MQLGLGRHGAIADSDHGCIEFLAVGFGREQCVDGIALEFIRRLATELGDPPVAAQDLSSGGEQDSGQRIVDPRSFRAHPGEVLSRDRLLNEVWGYNYFGTTRTLDQVIVQLRKKLGDNGGSPKYLVTVHGVGYKLEKNSAAAH